MNFVLTFQKNVLHVSNWLKKMSCRKILMWVSKKQQSTRNILGQSKKKKKNVHYDQFELVSLTLQNSYWNTSKSLHFRCFIFIQSNFFVYPIIPTMISKLLLDDICALTDKHLYTTILFYSHLRGESQFFVPIKMAVSAERLK